MPIIHFKPNGQRLCDSAVDYEKVPGWKDNPHLSFLTKHQDTSHLDGVTCPACIREHLEGEFERKLEAAKIQASTGYQIQVDKLNAKVVTLSRLLMSITSESVKVTPMHMGHDGCHTTFEVDLTPDVAADGGAVEFDGTGGYCTVTFSEGTLPAAKEESDPVADISLWDEI